MTEITEQINGTELAGKVLYDGECAICQGAARRFEPLLARYGFRFMPLQDRRVQAAFAEAEEDLMREMRVVSARGRVYGGVDALLEIMRAIWWAWPLYALAFLPGIRPALRVAYRWVAKNRHCIGGACAVGAKPWWPGWAPLAVLAAGATACTFAFAPWLAMCTISVALFAGLKWLTWWRLARRGFRVKTTRLLAYFALWPGMDAHAFLLKDSSGRVPRAAEYAAAVAKIALGAALIWIGVRAVQEWNVVAAGWTGMIGVVFVLHFGVLHLAALIFQNAGFVAPPIMRAPVLARSLTEFWSERWNLAFRDFVNPFVFRPVSAKYGIVAGTMATFAASGLVHELAISVPARGGFGLPTAYFILQGLGLILERSAVARRMGLRRGARGWLFTMLITAVPAFILFHPPFVQRVVLPFLDVIGAR